MWKKSKHIVSFTTLLACQDDCYGTDHTATGVDEGKVIDLRGKVIYPCTNNFIVCWHKSWNKIRVLELVQG